MNRAVHPQDFKISYSEEQSPVRVQNAVKIARCPVLTPAGEEFAPKVLKTTPDYKKFGFWGEPGWSLRDEEKLTGFSPKTVFFVH